MDTKPEKPKQPKQFYVQYEFVELNSVKMNQSWHGSASNMGMAAHQAFKEIRTRPGVKARRLHRAKVTIVEMTSQTSE